MSRKTSRPGRDRLLVKVPSEPDAFARLYRENYDTVFRYCVHRLFHRETAEDITSTVFFQALRNFRSFRGNEQGFRYWLYRIATNAVNSHLRSHARREKLKDRLAPLAVRSKVETHDATEERAAKLALLRTAMLLLKPDEQTVIALRFFENMKASEMGAVLGRSSATVRSQISRALVKLRKRMGSLAGESETEAL